MEMRRLRATISRAFRTTSNDRDMTREVRRMRDVALDAAEQGDTARLTRLISLMVNLTLPAQPAAKRALFVLEELFDLLPDPPS